MCTIYSEVQVRLKHFTYRDWTDSSYLSSVSNDQATTVWLKNPRHSQEEKK